MEKNIKPWIKMLFMKIMENLSKCFLILFKNMKTKSLVKVKNSSKSLTSCFFRKIIHTLLEA
ncbi:hypothetical protein BpHYR1_018418 [Brachionus plicatilis]|uniref:Uncharacterized protein n=1 Tax=Brachionus plicatilis TaxID=10195 RepID=A0A3M7QZT9_BRAPC|nr:hypothetical protein BpHYR1_018418 [Brachionus plicatilis]